MNKATYKGDNIAAHRPGAARRVIVRRIIPQDRRRRDHADQLPDRSRNQDPPQIAIR